MISIDEIKEMVEDREYDYIGLRIDDNVNYGIGDIANVSRVWDNNELTDETLDGTCCIGISIQRMLRELLTWRKYTVEIDGTS